MPAFFSAGAKALISAQRWILFICCVCVVIGLFAQVILRYVFGTALLGLSEIILIPTLWMYFIGASYASAQGTHISANVLQAYIGNVRAKAVIRAIVAVISLVVGLVLSWWACLYVDHSLNRPGHTSVFELPLISVQSAVLVGFFLMTFYTAVSLFSAITDLRTETGPRAEPDRPADAAATSAGDVKEG